MSAFIISDRNLGGRKVILDQLQNHRKALLNIKPTMTETSRPPKAHVDQGGQYFGDNPYYLSVYLQPNGPLGLRKNR